MGVQINASWWVSGTWEGRPIHEYLERRDITAVFRFLHARGVSYGAMAALVGISANRAAEIAKGVRQVTAYEVLERIAEGLNIPRAAMGLGRAKDLASAARTLAATSSGEGPNAGPTTAVGVDGVGEQAGTLAHVRAELDEALASSSVTPRQLDLLEESAREHMRVYPAASPAAMLSLLATECAEVKVLSRRRQPAAVQARLSGTAALLATMCADALMRLGDVGEARLWYRTAMQAADDSSEARLRVLVRAQAAMLPYYFGDLRQTVALAEAALAVKAPASSSTALAAAGRARALARLGAAEQARMAIDHARQLFDEAGDEDCDTAFHFPAKRLLFYLSGATTWLRDTRDAYRIQEEALTLYGQSSTVAIDPALIALDRSICLVHDKRAAEAAATAREAIAILPAAQRTEIILTRASDVVSALPGEHRGAEVAELTDYVQACREHARTLTRGPAALDP